MPVPVGGYSQGFSCRDRMLYGLKMGLSVGFTLGAIMGSISAFRAGLRGRELIRETGKVMMQYGGTFGVFMTIGSAMRC